jgi:uncharacterized protein YxeA
MKKIIYVLILLVVVVSGLVFANREVKNESKPSQKTLSVANKKANVDEKKKWEASPDGIKYKEWQTSAEGKKVYASYINIKRYIKAFTDMEAVVTSVTFQRENANASGPKWLIVRIEGEEYMMQFTPKDFQHLSSLKVNDKIVVRSRSASFSNNHPYLILSSDYIKQDYKILFKREFKNDGC